MLYNERVFQRILAFFANLAVILGIQTPLHPVNPSIPSTKNLAPATSTLIYCCLPDMPSERNCQAMPLPDCTTGIPYPGGNDCLAHCPDVAPPVEEETGWPPLSPEPEQGASDDSLPPPTEEPTDEESNGWCCDNLCEDPLPISQCAGTIFGNQLDCRTACGIPEAYCPAECSAPGSGLIRFAAKLVGGSSRCDCPQK